uniref:Uncharacterized protein n=1 Tax=Alexandrium monilatum TaxID=311494 RepID=A0A7S4UQC8_9DINO|mmetsp:Transcript_37839/g.112996  ORF Transcript_37839/g.112996 Transcript_37839/m.112996 type:complete len:197 (+) Transcript_37839:42-632(+)
MAPPRWKKTRSRQRNIRRDNRPAEVKAQVARHLATRRRQGWEESRHRRPCERKRACHFFEEAKARPKQRKLSSREHNLKREKRREAKERWAQRFFAAQAKPPQETDDPLAGPRAELDAARSGPSTQEASEFDDDPLADLHAELDAARIVPGPADDAAVQASCHSETTQEGESHPPATPGVHQGRPKRKGPRKKAKR